MKILVSIISFLSSIYTPIVSPVINIVKSYKNSTTGEVFVSKNVISAIEDSPKKEEILNKLYNIK